MNEKIVEAVARAIAAQDWRNSLDQGTQSDEWDRARDAYDLTNNNGRFLYEETARAAIDAYEAAKREAEEPFVTKVEKEINYDPAWAGQTSIHTALDGTRYKATWLDFDKAGGPKLNIEKLQ